MKTIILTLVLFFQSCAFQKLALDNADTLALFEMNKRLHLKGEQKDELEKDLKSYLNSRKNLSQNLAPLLDGLDLKSPEKIKSDYRNLETIYKKESDEIMTIFSHYLGNLSLDQREKYFSTVDDENAELEEKLKKEFMSQTKKRFEEFFGPLTSEQEKLLQNRKSYFKERQELRLQRRKNLRATFEKIYAQNLTLEARKKAFQTEFIHYRETSLKDSKNLEILLEFSPTLTPDQVKFFQQKKKMFKDLLTYFATLSY